MFILLTIFRGGILCFYFKYPCLGFYFKVILIFRIIKKQYPVPGGSYNAL